MAKLYIGLSGYSYKEWQGEGLFYPPKMKQSEFLDYYASRYNALEADGTWYQMPSEAIVSKWIGVCPDEFKISPKMHREVTHMARLKPQCFSALTNFVKKLERLEAAGKLGPILVQLPPNLKRDDARLNAFLSELPLRESLQWSMEFRHESWHAPEVEQALREKAVAWAIVDTDEAEAQRRDTAGFIYVRMRKTEYPEELLKSWSNFFRAKIDAGIDCFVYCKHKDAEAPWVWADRIIELVGAP